MNGIIILRFSLAPQTANNSALSIQQRMRKKVFLMLIADYIMWSFLFISLISPTIYF